MKNHQRQKEGIRQHMESQLSVLKGKVRRSHSGWNFIAGHSDTNQEVGKPQATNKVVISQRIREIFQRYHSEDFSGDEEDWLLHMTLCINPSPQKNPLQDEPPRRGLIEEKET
jgi:hypothetical protein